MEKKFLKILKESFKIYLETSPRSNEKLKVLHREIASDILYFLKKINVKSDKYTVSSLGHNKEEKIKGRYIDKMVDIVINKNGKPVGGVAIKYVMSNYKQNSNNYFENMLGETANIRSNNIPYFQIVLLLEEVPYYTENKKISRWEKINYHNIEKYVNLSKDNVKMFLHTPDKTLLCLIKYPINRTLSTKKDYENYYIKEFDKYDFAYVSQNWSFDESVIFNNYVLFLEKLTYNILSR